jgi:hypothetical protein
MVAVAVDGGGLLRVLGVGLSLLNGYCAYGFDGHKHLHFLDLGNRSLLPSGPWVLKVRPAYNSTGKGGTLHQH